MIKLRYFMLLAVLCSVLNCLPTADTLFDPVINEIKPTPTPTPTPTTAPSLRFTETGSYSLFPSAVTCSKISGEKIIAGTQVNGIFHKLPNGAWANINTANGLISNQINDIFVDGTKWYIATLNGLSIYDTQMLTFSSKLIGTQIYSIIVTDSTVYLGTSEGYQVSEKEEIIFTAYTTTDGLPSNSVKKIFKEGSSIYLATESGVVITDTLFSSLETYTTTDGIYTNSVSEIFSSGNTVICGTNDRPSVSTSKGGSWQTPSAGSADITGIAASEEYIFMVKYGEDLYFSNDNGLSWYPCNLPSIGGMENVLSNDILVEGGLLYISHDNGILIGTVQ